MKFPAFSLIIRELQGRGEKARDENPISFQQK